MRSRILDMMASRQRRNINLILARSFLDEWGKMVVR